MINNITRFFFQKSLKIHFKDVFDNLRYVYVNLCEVTISNKVAPMCIYNL